MVIHDERKAPESYLELAREEAGATHRGRLKIFLGAFPGAGKTFAMLEEARVRKRAGIDVVIGLVETHGRTETAELAAGLDEIPRIPVVYRGQRLHELDVDAILARRPQLALIDEFAHTNAPGMRHPKRWQDVLEIVDAGIDVTTTLNVQHIESLNDAVARITGVRVQETVPDEVFRKADEIELIDLTPEELIARLKQGKVYVPHQAARALENFFTKGKLTALRELAMRTAAGRVDADMLRWMEANAVRGPWPTEERLLVCLGQGANAKALVRAGKRMADRARIPWIVAKLQSAMGAGVGDEPDNAQEAMPLAESLGAETATVPADDDIVASVLGFARRANATRILVGVSGPASFAERLKRLASVDFARSLLDRGGDFDIVFVASAEKSKPKAAALQAAPRRAFDRTRLGRTGLEAVVATAVATVVAWPMWPWFPVASIAIPYLVASLVVSFRRGLTGALMASALGFLAYNFFFTTPYYSFRVHQYESVLALVVFVVSALFTGTLASRLRKQFDSVRAAQRRTETLYGFSRNIASVTKIDDALWAAAAHTARALDCDALILLADANDALQQVQGFPSIVDLDARSEGAARWAYEKREPAGAGTSTLPIADWLFLPLATSKEAFGVIGVKFRARPAALDPEIRKLLEAVVDQVAVAIERSRLADELSDAKVAVESDRLRTALLNSISHDLRTPLVSVIGALSNLSEFEDGLDRPTRASLVATALDEARRLDRYIQNLLDMTRLGHGALKPKRVDADVREIIGAARHDLGAVLEGRPVEIDLPRDLPLVAIDPALTVQALANVIENAAKYSPAGSPIRLSAAATPTRVALSVSDRGPGIPEDQRELVFDAFYRITRGDQAPAGTGLGLAIVKGLIEAQGGSVRAAGGEGGTGATIVMELPVSSQDREGEGERR